MRELTDEEQELLRIDIEELLYLIGKIAPVIECTPLSEALSAVGSAIVSMDRGDEMQAMAASEMLAAIKMVADASTHTFLVENERNNGNTHLN